MISKELLKLVLLYPQNEFVDFIKQNDEFIKYGARVQDQISVYELSHKCKEWAYTKGYTIWSSAIGKECYIDGRIFTNGENIRFLDNSEHEAIFKACEWILKEIQK